MTITQDNYLDVFNLFINEFVGDVFLFLIIGLVLIGFLALKFRLPIEVVVFVVLVFIGGVMSYVFNSLAWMLILIIVGGIIYSLLPKLISRK